MGGVYECCSVCCNPVPMELSVGIYCVHDLKGDSSISKVFFAYKVYTAQDIALVVPSCVHTQFIGVGVPSLSQQNVTLIAFLSLKLGNEEEVGVD